MGASILVKFRAGTSAATQEAVNRRHGGVAIGSIRQLGVQIVRVHAGTAPDQVRAYGRESTVTYAEPNARAEAADVPNDPSFSLQWSLNKIKAPGAWDTTHGSSNILIAVLDTGVSLSHPDLAPKIVISKNFSSSASVDDVKGHGSHVAGIAAAATNNGAGIAGLGYDARIANGKVLGDDGYGSYSAIAQGITWAADNGANVINLSLVGTTPSSTLESAVNYAWSKGAVVVAAAGNDANSTPTYPASYTNAIAVAATTDLDQLATFSSYGSWVDVAAPGITIYSTIPGGYGYKSGTSMASPLVAGLASLLFMQLHDSNGNGRLNDEVRTQIQATADDVGVSGIGSGRINAYEAASGATTDPPANGAIAGVVTDAPTGAPLAGATVSNGSAGAVTDAAGAYTLPNLPAGSYTVTASAAGHSAVSQSVSLTSGQTANASFSLINVMTNGAISGRVTDGSTGLAIAGAAVSNGSASVLTDVTGSYTLANLAPGSYTVNASAAGYTGASQSISVTSGQTATAGFTLSQPAPMPATMWASAITFRTTGKNLRIDVKVTSPGGPVAGAQALLTVAWSGGTSWGFSGSTDSTGTASFTIPKAPKGTYIATLANLTGAATWDRSAGVSSGTYTMT
jgi:thermitase